VEKEFCIICDEPTGNAGKGDGSIYGLLMVDHLGRPRGDEIGPLCDSCFDKLADDEMIVQF